MTAKTMILLGMLLSGAAGAAEYLPDYGNWSGGAADADGGYTARSESDGASIRSKLPELAPEARRVLSFEWRYAASTPINYAAFEFSARERKQPLYIWFDGVNGARGDRFAADVWHRVEIGLDKLAPFAGEPPTPENVLTGLRFHLAFAKGQTGTSSLSIRHFKISEMSAADAAALRLSAEPVRIWPRQEPVIWPTGLRQFALIELPAFDVPEAVRLTLELPAGVTLLGVAGGTSPAMPPESGIVRPEAYRQEGRTATFDFAPGATGGKAQLWLPLAIRVDADPGETALDVELAVGGKTVKKQSIPVKIYPALTGKRPKKLKLGAYDYHGLDEFSLPVFCEMMQRSGIREIHHMRGEDGKTKTTADFAAQYGFRDGLVFFVHHIQEFFAGRQLADGKTFPTESVALLLEHPAVFKEMVTVFFREKFAGKPYRTVIFDAERGGWRNGKAQGEMSPATLAAFRTYAKLPENEPLSAEIITTKYKEPWVWFICEQSNRIARLVREVLDESWPDIEFQAYSGYEYDDGPLANRTRELYGTDWKTMRATGIDFAVAGYCGTPAQLRHTAEVTGTHAPYLPADMYIENFLAKRIGDCRPEVWSMRLIESYLSGSRRGIMLWYANVFDGAALVAVDRLADFMARIEEFALRGQLDRQAVKVMPEADENCVTVLRDGGNLLIVALNRGNEPKRLRLRLTGVKLQGYTGELAITDLVTGEKIKPSGTIPVEVPAYGYRLLQLMDDGN
jgi:hypothetical protein